MQSTPIKVFIENKDYEGIRRTLSNNPQLANEGITIPYDSMSTVRAHPLHRICDAVFAKKISDEEAIEIAKIFLEFGANINGAISKENEDTPLLAAASLHAELLGLFYINKGADIHYRGRNDGATALHWAGYCGRDKLVERLVQEKAAIDLPDRSYNSSPLRWAIQPLITGDQTNMHNQVPCIKLLLKAGANISNLGDKPLHYLQELAKDDVELNSLLK